MDLGTRVTALTGQVGTHNPHPRHRFLSTRAVLIFALVFALAFVLILAFAGFFLGNDGRIMASAWHLFSQIPHPLQTALSMCAWKLDAQKFKGLDRLFWMPSIPQQQPQQEQINSGVWVLDGWRTRPSFWF
jgi:hypothetical protein